MRGDEVSEHLRVFISLPSLFQNFFEELRQVVPE